MLAKLVIGVYINTLMLVQKIKKTAQSTDRNPNEVKNSINLLFIEHE